MLVAVALAQRGPAEGLALEVQEMHLADWMPQAGAWRSERAEGKTTV